MIQFLINVIVDLVFDSGSLAVWYKLWDHKRFLNNRSDPVLSQESII